LNVLPTARTRSPYWRLRASAELERRRRAGVLGRDHDYRPRGAAAELQACEAPEVIIAGSAGTGKSRACLEKIHRLARQYPRSRYLFIRKTMESLRESALLTYERDVLGGSDHPIAAGCSRQARRIYRYPNGSSIVIGGMDKPRKIMSTEYDVIYVQEAVELQEEDWETLTTRLRNAVLPYQQIIGDTNPDAPTHWLKRRCDRGITRMLESRHEDNPTLWDAERGEWTALGADYLARLDRLTGLRYERYRLGRWVRAEGVVYEEWDARLHHIYRFEIPADWRRFRVVDFGYTNPFCCQWWAVDGDGRMYLYREIYMTRRTVAEHAEQILALSEGERIESTICDHDAEDRATLEAHGIRTRAARKAVLPGIQAVKERLKPAGDGRPRLFILRDSLVEEDPRLVEAKLPTCTVQEIDSYVWSNKTAREQPVKKEDHGMDCVRYGTVYLDSAGKRPALVRPAGVVAPSRWRR